jgi:4-amino-4-deoxy-L-arabinose transferase-like glycosyltransferase
MATEQTHGEGHAGRFTLSLITRWFAANRIDLAILVALAALAASLRLTMLTEIPAGLHGDEAWTGIDAARVLDKGWIGPYVRSAVGQPTGVLYLAAPFVHVFGETIFAIRALSAVLGIATVLMAYMTFRVMFDRPTAAFAAIILAVSLWHLHFSRIAFTLIAWPLMELVTLLFIFLGLKKKQWPYFGLAGVALGAGVYTYNAYSTVAAALAVFLALVFAGAVCTSWRLHEGRSEPVALLGKLSLMAALAVAVAAPLLLYAADPDNDYFFHHKSVSLLETEDWEAQSFSGRADLLLDGVGDFIDAAFWSGVEDGADGSGETAMVDRVSLALLLAGVVVLAWRWPGLASIVVLLMILMIPLAAVLTTGGIVRRSFGIVPFLALLAAAPLGAAWSWADRLSFYRRYAAYGAVVAVVGIVAYLNLSYYFDEFPESHVARETFDQELVEAANFMAGLPDDQVVYFYSEGWSYQSEVVRYLGGGLLGEDRSTRIEPDPRSDVAYVFMQSDVGRIDEVVAKYPGGTRVDGGSVYQAYLLPRSQEPAFEGEIPRDRDGVRIRDLSELQRVLDTYALQEGVYPDTGSTLQALCAVSQTDAGCALLDVAELPSDPLGDPSANGYFYASDGNTYTLYARRESLFFESCDDHPEALANFESLVCVRGP